jgi:hypothetical protein
MALSIAPAFGLGYVYGRIRERMIADREYADLLKARGRSLE